MFFVQWFDDKNVTMINESRFEREHCDDACYKNYAMSGNSVFTGSVCSLTCRHTHTHKNVRMLTYNTHMHVHVHTHTHKMHMCSHTHMPVHTYTHTRNTTNRSSVLGSTSGLLEQSPSSTAWTHQCHSSHQHARQCSYWQSPGRGL